MDKYELSVNLVHYSHLDDFALLTSQDYNLGNIGKWFNAFRGGLYGFHARINGFLNHYHTVHAWITAPREPSETEHHLASIFFCMDSAIECLTFALNALGGCASPDEFRDITNDRDLRKISPKDILGETPAKSSKLPLPGYKNIFPRLQNFWETKRDMIGLIVEQHDVSKHRETIFSGGKVRDDVPPRFFESLGMNENDDMAWIYSPMAEIILKKDPKSAYIDRTPQEVEDFVLLEDIAVEFLQFVELSGELAFQDVKISIKLKHSNFLK